jgi:imidazolonepropionase-like amidohydrolase
MTQNISAPSIFNYLSQLPFKSILFGMFCLFGTSVSSQGKSTLYLGATIHTGVGTVWENGAMSVKEGKIEWLGDARLIRIDPSQFDTIIQLGGKHIYPGLIAPNSTIGIREVDAVRATLDFSETGEMNPNVRSAIAFNTDSRIIPTVRSNGILLVQSAPQGGLVSGTSSVFQLHGWNWEDAVVKADDGIYINWPSSYSRPSRYRSDTAAAKKEKEHRDQLEQLFADARAYYLKGQHEKVNLKLHAMQGLFDGKKRLFIRSNRAPDMLSALAFAKRFDVRKVVIVGGAEADKIIETLIKEDVGVILQRTHRLPDHPDEAIDQPFRQPGILHKAGVLCAISNEGDMEAMGTRNLAYQAGTAAAYGISKEDALRLVTSNTAKLLGIDQSFGSLEEGKKAYFVISDGDLMDMKEAVVSHIVFEGKMLDANYENHQFQLYLKYMEKFGM